MKTYLDIALEDLKDARKCSENKQWRMAIFAYQQFAEKGAKSLLERINPNSKLLNSHNVASVLESYNTAHVCSYEGDCARYFTNFYIKTRYPVDDYIEVIEEYIERAEENAQVLYEFYKKEHEKLDKLEKQGMELS